VKILIPLLAAFLISSPALASYETIATKAPAVTAPAKPTHICRVPDKVIEDALASGKVTVKADLKGDALKKFNDNYAAATGQEAPTLAEVDRMVVFESKTDAPYFLAIMSVRDCIIGGQPILKKSFEKFVHPGDAI
jgi:hypothetical protein